MSHPTPPPSINIHRLYEITPLQNDGSNYQTWKVRMEAVLENRELWEVVEGKKKRPTDSTEAAEWDKRGREARTQMILALGDEPLRGVAQIRDPATMWRSLCERYEGKGAQSIVLQIGALFRNTLSDESPLEPQLNEMAHRANVLASLGVEFDESITAAAMVLSLPESYSMQRAILTSTLEKPNIERVRTAILAEERARTATLGSAVALKAYTKGKDEEDKDRPRCKFCGRKGHVVEDCYQKKSIMEEIQKEMKGMRENTLTDQTSDHMAKIARVHRRSSSFDDPIQLFLAASHNNPLASTPVRNLWIIDSGAHPSMSCRRDWFKTYHQLANPKHVYLGDKRSILALGYGSIEIMATGPGHGDRRITLPHVYFVPSLNGNMLSVSQIAQMGYKIHFNSNGCKVYGPSNEFIATGQNNKGLYTMKFWVSRANPPLSHTYHLAKETENSHKNLKATQVHHTTKRSNSDERHPHPSTRIPTNAAAPESLSRPPRRCDDNQVGEVDVSRSSVGNDPGTHHSGSCRAVENGDTSGLKWALHEVAVHKDIPDAW